MKICIVKFTPRFSPVTAFGHLRTIEKPPYLCIKFVTTAQQ
jgi:hypothetical protein